MNVVNPENTNHNLKIIPRFEIGGEIVFELYNEQTQVISTPSFTSGYIDGYLTLNYDFDFIDKEKYQIKITDDNVVIYRGKLMATTQDTQTYKSDNELYYYE